MKQEIISRGIKVNDLLDMLLPVLSPFVPDGECAAAITHWAVNLSQHSPLMNKQLHHLAIGNISKHYSASSVKHNSKSHQKENDLHNIAIDWDGVPYPNPDQSSFTFIDLFAGIGGIRIAFQESGGKCVFSSEWDANAKKTYFSNFGEIPFGDIRTIPKQEIPDHDVLCAGFPCQPFSLAGVSKKNSMGRKHGFDDITQGTLFFEIKEILRLKRPKAFLLENVKNLVSHDKGKTFSIIKDTLQNQLGYVVKWAVVDGANWVPQHRERIFIVGYDPSKIGIKEDEIVIPSLPDSTYVKPSLSDIISMHVEGHTLGKGTWDALNRHKDRHFSKGNGFGFALIKTPVEDGINTRTISARYHKDGAEILIEQPGDFPRRLTVLEAMQLQGFDPLRFIFPVSRMQAYKQIGNSVVIPAVRSTALEIAKVLNARSMS